MISQRYSGIVNNFSEYTYHILGCGAIGSATATQLVRMGATYLKLYDMDTVGTENIGVSMFRVNDIGTSKTQALKTICLTINIDVKVDCIEGRFERYDFEDDKAIVILAFDTMKSRLEAVTKILETQCKKPDYIIDGRMGAEHYQQYVIKNPTLKKYLNTWYSDEQGSPEPCSAKATSYCSNMSGSFICNTVRKLLTKQPYHKEISFFFPTMTLETF